MSTDEDKMIKKLEEHRDTIKCVVEIAELNDIEVTPTKGNESKGDFSYNKKDKKNLIKALDVYLGKYKYTKTTKKEDEK